MRTTILAFAGALIVLVCVPSALHAKPKSPRSNRDRIYTAQQAKRGQSVYARTCAACHGAELEGISAKCAPPLVGEDFDSVWNGLSMDELFERIQETMPDDNKGSLTRQDTANLVAFILSKGKSPSGPSELSPSAATLKQIKYLTAKP